LWGISFTNANNGTTVGDFGTILRTTNGGKNWFSQFSGITNDLFGISFTDENNGTAVGQVGTILRTTDGGEHWVSQTSGTLYDLSAVSLTDKNNGTTVGGYGTILRTINGGVTFIEDESNFTKPTDFLLSQNYPNPFNPTTSIQYAVSNRQFVSLKVYDVLGNEVATLVNEEKPGGSYEIEFNGDGLTSGIYFYQLKAGSFVETKKMVLLK